jgi:cytochrome c-type biogenesis protein CcsB
METLEQYSILLVYSAMAIYALAFISFALDLARRSSQAKADAVETTPSELVGASVAGSRAAAGVSARAPHDAVVGSNSDSAAPRRSVTLRIGVALTVIGFLLQLGGVVLRGIAAERVPWANMYEFSITGTLLIMGVFLVVLLREDLRFLGTFITGLVLILLGVSTVNYYVAVVPLPPALESAWLVIHVFVASLGTAFFALGGALSGIQLLQNRRETAGGSKFLNFRLLDTLPNSVRLENLAYRINIVGFVFWTFTLIAGAVWAERAWGRYWGWDTKEVWTFIIWVIYAGYIHARATKGWRGSRSAWLALIGFAAVLFNFGVVNVFFKGLHAYSGL